MRVNINTIAFNTSKKNDWRVGDKVWLLHQEPIEAIVRDINASRTKVKLEVCGNGTTRRPWAGHHWYNWGDIQPRA